MSATSVLGCGHAANAINERGEPACAICVGTPRENVTSRTADLTGRVARCGCGAERPSSTSLAFFEYLGPGSYEAVHGCASCGYFDVAHVERQRPHPFICESFTPRGDRGRDRYYCGCRGWN